MCAVCMHRYAFLINERIGGMQSMNKYEECVIKSFKHDGHLHRVWQQNWLVPHAELFENHQDENMIVVINRQTPIMESDGKKWVSRVPAVSFFIPGCWYNVVALIEDKGVRYYCNIASPVYFFDGIITYIDYDLDVILTHDGHCYVVDEDEYEMHKLLYHYSPEVEAKAQKGLQHLMDRIEMKNAPFQDQQVKYYYERWAAWNKEDL